MIDILTWMAIISGGVLMLLMLISLIGGLEMDVEVGSTDIETDAGGIGLIKGFLSFLSVGSWVMKVILVTSENPAMALTIGILSGMLAYFLLNYLFKLLLKNESNVNWKMTDAVYQIGDVYLRIPETDGNGIITININGSIRELKAKSYNNIALETGAKVMVVKVDEEYAYVERQTN